MKNADFALAVSTLTGMPMGVWSLVYIKNDEDNSESRDDVSLCAVVITDRTRQSYLDFFLCDGERCIECNTPPSIEQDQGACADLILSEKFASEIRTEMAAKNCGTFALPMSVRDRARDEIMAKAAELVSRTPLLAYAQSMNTMLKTACDEGDFAQARRLIESGKDPMAFEHHALCSAIEHGKADFVEWMLSAYYSCEEIDFDNILHGALQKGLNRKETDDCSLARTIHAVSNHVSFGKRITTFRDAILTERPESLKALLDVSKNERESKFPLGMRLVMHSAITHDDDIYIEILLRNGFASDGSPRVQAIADRIHIESRVSGRASRGALRRTSP